MCILQNGNAAASLSVAEQYVSAFSNLAKQSNTILLPSNTADVSGMVTQVCVHALLHLIIFTALTGLSTSRHDTNLNLFPCQAMTIYSTLAKANTAPSPEVVEEKKEIWKEPEIPEEQRTD